MENKDKIEGIFTIAEDDTAADSDQTEKVSEEASNRDEAELAEISLSDFSGEGEFIKKPRGNRFSRWWKARKTWQKSLMIIGLVFLIIIGLLAGMLLTSFGYNYNSISKNPNDLGFENVLDENIVNVALFGIDTRSIKSFEGNSDSIMILSLNTITKKVKIISVMRDTLVPVTYDGRTTYGKINSAYSRGGPELAIKTLNTVFGLDISEYATVNFYGMMDIIDAVGGIEAELTEGEVTKSTYTKALNFCIKELCGKLKLDPEDYYIYEAGTHQLNGVQAVAYSRIRYVANIWGTNNDYGRTDRQRHVMEQLFNKALTLEKSQYIKLAKSLIPCSETSLSYSEIMGLAVDILLESPTFHQTRMPQQEFLMNSPSGYGSVVYYDLDFAKKLIHAFIYEDISPEDYIAANGIEKNDWYANRFSGSGTSSGSGWNSGTSSQVTNSGVVDPNYSGITSSGTDSQTGIIQDPSTSDPAVDSDIDNSSDDTGGSGDGTGSDGSGTDSEPTESDENGTSSPDGTGSGTDGTGSGGTDSGSSDTNSGSSDNSSTNSSGGSSSSDNSTTQSGAQGGSADNSSGSDGTTPSAPATGTQ